jgi:hypothetical protein
MSNPKKLFHLPETFSKSIAPSTKKMYTSLLNRLAKAGFETPADLKERAEEVVTHISTLTISDDDDARHTRRKFVSSVLWVMPEDYRKQENPYYLLNKSSMPSFFIKKMNE